jgi:hypothetical protein
MLTLHLDAYHYGVLLGKDNGPLFTRFLTIVHFSSKVHIPPDRDFVLLSNFRRYEVVKLAENDSLL